jgi:hypothetical protein
LREDVAKALRCDGAGADACRGRLSQGPPKASNLDLYLIIATDASNFRTGTDTQADRKAAQRRAPVYKYYFQWYSPVRGGVLRAMHTMDIPFVFENYELAGAARRERPRAEAARRPDGGRVGGVCHDGQPEPSARAEVAGLRHAHPRDDGDQQRLDGGERSVRGRKEGCCGGHAGESLDPPARL